MFFGKKESHLNIKDRMCFLSLLRIIICKFSVNLQTEIDSIFINSIMNIARA